MSDEENNDGGDTENNTDNNNNNNKKTNNNTKKGPKPTPEEIKRSIERKTWVERIALILLVAALIVYFVVLIVSMVSSANSKLVETQDIEKEMNIPYVFVLFESTTDNTSSVVDCSFELYTDGAPNASGTYEGTTLSDTTMTNGWSIINLAEYASDAEDYTYTGVIITPPPDAMVPIQRKIQNYLEFSCTDDNMTIYVNLYYEGQYDQYEEGAEEVDSISYDAYECKLAYDTNFDVEWSTIIDELVFAQKPEELDGIEGAYDYYEMELSGIYPLTGNGKNRRGIATYAGYRKHAKYTYQDAVTFFDVIAGVGGMYTSLASILAWFVAKFLWGQDFKVYKWAGFAPHAPKTTKKEGEEEGGGDDE